MQKFERRFESGTLRSKDVERQFQEDSPEQTFDFLRSFWDIDIPSPQVKAVYKEAKGLEDIERGCIELGVVEIEDLRRTFGKAGRKVSGSDLIKTLIAEKFSILASMRLNPKNWECEFCVHQPEDYTLEDFEKYVSVSTQNSSIGDIGTRAVERQLGIYDAVKTREAFEKLYLKIEEKIGPNSKRNLQKSKHAFKVMTQYSPSALATSKNSLAEAEETRKKNLDLCMQLAIAGTTTLYVTDHVESAYNSKFPELIVKNFEANPRYVRCFNNFVGQYMPTFAESIKDATCLLRKPDNA